MTSTHTSLAALRAPSRSPLAALLQIPSTLLLTLAESVGAAWIEALQAVTACCTAALLAPLAVPAGVLVADVEDVPAPAGLVETLVETLWLLDVELLLLPQPATNTAPRTATTSHADNLRNI